MLLLELSFLTYSTRRFCTPSTFVDLQHDVYTTLPETPHCCRHWEHAGIQYPEQGIVRHNQLKECGTSQSKLHLQKQTPFSRRILGPPRSQKPKFNAFMLGRTDPTHMSNS